MGLARRDDGTFAIDDDERRMWVLNDEGLYLLQQEEQKQGVKGGIRAFVQRHREEIDAVITAALNRKPRS